MEDPKVLGLLFIAIGIVAMLGAALNWRIVSHPGKILNRIFGDSIARIIYFVAGIFLFVVGVGRLIGANWF
jgi:Na+/H+ antiporter NhaD/arsenite permease-like protein